MKRIFKIVFSGVLAFSGASCSALSTEYKPFSFGNFGGYKEKSLGEDIYLVSAVSNGFSEHNFAVKSALLRSAEITEEKGFTHFEILEAAGENNYTVVNNSSKTYTGQDVSYQIKLLGPEDVEGEYFCNPLMVLVSGNICNAPRLLRF